MTAPIRDASWIRNQLEHLINGYSFYERRTQVRADDLLLRQHVAASLDQATATLRAKHGRVAATAAVSREQPMPPAEVLQALRALDGARRSLDDLATLVRAAPLGAMDRTHERLRRNLDVLAGLWTADLRCAELGGQISAQARAVDEAQRPVAGLDVLDGLLAGLASAVRDRDTLLLPL